MATITGQNTTYVLRTPDELNSTDSSNSRLVVINNPIIICPNNAPEPVQVSSLYQNRKVLKGANNAPVPVKRLFNTIKCYGGRKKPKNHLPKQDPLILNPTLPIAKSRKKLCYETEFKPAVPSTTGSSKGFIRYGNRHLIVDQRIFISPRQFKHQLNYTDDLYSTSGMAPRTKKEMERLVNGITKLFAQPAHKMLNSELLDLYVVNCVHREAPNVETNPDMELLPLGHNPRVNTTFKMQKRKYTKKSATIKVNEILEEAAETINDHQYTKEDNETIELIEEQMNTEESVPSTSKMKNEDDKMKNDDGEMKNDDDDDEMKNEDDDEMKNEDDSDEMKIDVDDGTKIEDDDNEIITIISEEVKNEIEIDENDTFTMKSDELYTLKSEDDEDERQIVIIQRLGENIALSQKNLEVLLAAANGSDQSNQVVAIFTDDGSGFVSVKNETEEILGTDSELNIN